jgi:hypothetical protein
LKMAHPASLSSILSALRVATDQPPCTVRISACLACAEATSASLEG